MTSLADATHLRDAAGPCPTLEALKTRVPFAADIVQTFGALTMEQNKCRDALELELADMACDPDSFSQGTPLLSQVNPTAIRQLYPAAASCMMPALIRTFPSIAADLQALAQALDRDPGLAETVVDSVTENDNGLLAAKLNISPQVLAFAAREILKPCLQRASRAFGPLIADMPWSKPCCPVCGSGPDLAFLRPKDPEPSEFLISKSGQLWMHCSLCAHQWRYLRSKCPHCGETEPDKLMYYTDPDREAERIYACTQCNHYYPCVDITDRRPFPDLNLEPLALIHLDYLAREKGFSPLVDLPWNQFADAAGS